MIIKPSESTLNDKSLRTGTRVLVKHEGENFNGLIMDVKKGEYKIRCLQLTTGGNTYRFEDE